MAKPPRSRPLRRPLRDALADDDAPQLARVVTGVCVSHSGGSEPRVVLRLADGTTSAPLPYPAWWVPREGDVAVCMLQGGQLYIVSVTAPARVRVDPHRHQASDIDGTIIEPTPPPRPVPPPPTPAPTVREVNVQPVDMGSWGSPQWSAAENHIRQGGHTYDAFWFYGNRIAQAKGSGTIVGGTIYVERQRTSHGVGGAANVRLGTHTRTERPGASGAVSNVRRVGTLRRGQGRTFTLHSSHIAALNAGARGLGLGHGASGYTSADYLLGVTGGASGALSLTIES